MGSLSDTVQSKLQAAVEDAHLEYTQKNTLSKKSHEKACLYMPGGNTRTVLYATPFPMTIASGKSCYLTSIDGQEYVDFLGEYTAGIYGHNHPVIRKAIEQALDAGWNFGGHNVMEQKLAEIVCDRFPAVEKIRFVNSGTEANMMALATALAYTGKKTVLVFNKGYHGSTISGRLPSGKPTINLPHDFVVGTYNDVQDTDRIVKSLPEGALAAILVEPMLGSGGCYQGSAEFLSLLRKLATEHKALLIFDEVMTSRLSYHGLGYVTGIVPDLTTLGKWIGGGMSFGAFGGRDDLMSMYDPRKGELEHPGTFNNNVFSMNAGVAGCTLLTPQTIDTLNRLGDEMRDKVSAVLKRHGIQGTEPLSPVTDEMQEPASPSRPPKMFIKGVGSLMCIQFAGPDRDALQAVFYHHMLETGIYMAQRGFIALNIELTTTHVQRFIAAVDDFCQRWESALKW